MANVERVYLGWEKSFLHQASDWLFKRYADRRTWDLSDVSVVTGGKRSGRRLQEILCERGEGTVYSGPEFLTVGSLPKRLFTPPAAGLAVSEKLEDELVMMEVLRESEALLLEQLFKRLPGEDDFLGWYRLSKEMLGLRNQLAADLMTVRETIEICGEMTEWNDESRWAAVEATHLRFEERLEQRGKMDVHRARFEAIAEGRCGTDKDVVLVGTADLKRLTQKLIFDAAAQRDEKNDVGGGRITSLIYCGEEHADGFNEVGNLDLEYWDKHRVDVPNDVVWIVDKPSDQAAEVVRCLQEDGAGVYGIDEVTVGLGDEEMSGHLERTLELAGVPARSAVGRLATQTRGAMLLASLGQYVGRPSFEGFAGLLRHPDVEGYLRKQLGEDVETEDWLTLLDRYLTDHLQGRMSREWLGDPKKAEELKKIFDCVTGVIEKGFTGKDMTRKMALGEFSDVIGEMVSSVYEGVELDPDKREDQVLIRSLGMIGELLREQAGVAVKGDGMAAGLGGDVQLAQAIFFTLSRLEGQMIPQEGGTSAVELLGYLELAVDDAKRLIVTGFNEGMVPASMDADAFLPDHFRRALGLEDNVRRLIRDKYYLACLLGGERKVSLICGKRTMAGDPLMPSRLLLGGRTDEMIERIGQFYQEDEVASNGLLLEHGKRSALGIPKPTGDEDRLTELSVTGFKDYLVCPYRFYLKHVLKLRVMDDDAVEMDGMHFGSLMHTVLHEFGQSVYAEETHAQIIEKFLCDRLDLIIRKTYGRMLSGSLVIQVIGMKERLGGFARWQAKEAKAGWRIVKDYLEIDVVAEIAVRDEIFKVKGRIDRIDFHNERGYRVIDYKTGENGDGPEKTHRKGRAKAKTWTDLQLPLYKVLCDELGIQGVSEMGYVVLPSVIDEIGFIECGWDGDLILDGVDEAKRIAGLIMDEVYWPPSDLSASMKMFDLYSGICMEDCVDRAGVIAKIGYELSGEVE